jgi:hypothetical protein
VAGQSFSSVVQEHYTRGGRMSTSTAVALIHVKTGVSEGSIWKAVRGFRVAPETAKQLSEWVYLEHGVDLNVEAMVMAQTKPRRRGA